MRPSRSGFMRFLRWAPVRTEPYVEFMRPSAAIVTTT